LAADLVRLNVDLTFANSSTAARRATKTIPIVFANHADPVGVGGVSSLARPGGNITALTVILTEIVTKQLEIMKEELPHLKRIGVLVVVTAPSTRPACTRSRPPPTSSGFSPEGAGADARNLDGAFTMMTRERVSGYLAVQTPLDLACAGSDCLRQVGYLPDETPPVRDPSNWFVGHRAPPPGCDGWPTSRVYQAT
jgi:putative tryptophan/tyrosine transport system substrate-binding protein